jgi:hypothetical protein
VRNNNRNCDLQMQESTKKEGRKQHVELHEYSRGGLQ